MKKAPSQTKGSAIWQTRISSGYELFINTYSLAENDTTETISEATLQGGVSGFSRGGEGLAWRFNAEAGTGTELWREHLSGHVRWFDAGGNTRLKISGEGRARQYRQDTDYGLNSDNMEGRVDVQGSPLATGQVKFESRSWFSQRHYSVPSTLELDQRELGVGIGASSGMLARQMWSLGCRFFRRTFPDSAAIDRNTISMIGTLNHRSSRNVMVRLYHRSNRRVVDDDAVRPSAWTHWTDFDFQDPFAGGALFLELQNEVWRYDTPSVVYQNSWRAATRLGWLWGDELETRWRLGLSGEVLHSADDSESYGQYGLLGGIDGYAGPLAGSLLVEFGHREYTYAHEDEPAIDAIAEDLVLSDVGTTDFYYGKIWLTANWELSENLALDFMASYEPERHGEKNDDTSLAFASASLVWRP